MEEIGVEEDDIAEEHDSQCRYLAECKQQWLLAVYSVKDNRQCEGLGTNINYLAS